VTATTVLPDVHLDVDLDKPIPCHQPDCPHAAEWRFKLTCCKRVMMICDPHHERLIAPAAHGWICVDCDTEHGTYIQFDYMVRL
jgi:hypothetical protein